MQLVTTGFSDFTEDFSEVMTGEERWPILGDVVSEEEIWRVVAELKGLGRFWNCIDKARKCKEILGVGQVVHGSMLVWSGDWKSQYGFHWHPPYEFHSWVMLDGGLIDVALPGVVEKGLRTSDDVGPYLVQREPVILAGKPPDWLLYEGREIEVV